MNYQNSNLKKKYVKKLKRNKKNNYMLTLKK